MLQRFRKVSPTLYRSSAPSKEDVIWMHKHLGINRIISLDNASGDKIKLICSLLDMEHIELPIDFSRKHLMNFLLKIEKLFESKEKTLIHCFHGKDRTGLACAIYRCKTQGWSAEKAIKEADSLDFGTGLGKETVSLYKEIIRDSAKSDEDKEDVNAAFDYNGDTGTTSYTYPGAISDNLSWAPISNYHNYNDFDAVSKMDGANDFPAEFLNPENDISDDGTVIPESGITDSLYEGIGGASFSFPIPLTTV